MMSRVLVSANLLTRQQAIKTLLEELLPNQASPDLMYLLDDDKLGVEAIKKIRLFLSIKPLQSDIKVVVLESAQNLTIDAQNALLKTLEEPPGAALIILGVSSEHSLLPTVLSRCQVERLGDGKLTMNNEQFKTEIEQLGGKNIEERFEFIEKLEEKEQFLDALLIYFRDKLPKNLEFTKKLLQAKSWQDSNVNLRAILEYLMLELP